MLCGGEVFRDEKEKSASRPSSMREAQSADYACEDCLCICSLRSPRPEVRLWPHVVGSGQWNEVRGSVVPACLCRGLLAFFVPLPSPSGAEVKPAVTGVCGGL